MYPAQITPAAEHAQRPIWRVNTSHNHQDGTFCWPPHWSQGLTVFPTRVHDCSTGQVATLRNSWLSTCTTGFTGTLLYKSFSYNVMIWGVYFCFMTQPLLEVFFTMCMHFSLCGPEEGGLNYNQKSCFQLSLPDHTIISYYSKTSVEHLIHAKLADTSSRLSHWIITT